MNGRLWNAALVALAASGLATAAHAATEPPAITDSTLLVVAEDRSDTLVARRVTFAKPVHGALYDSASATLIVTYGGENQPAGGGQGITASKLVLTHVAYDLAHRRVLWTRQDDAFPLGIHGDRLVLGKADGGTLSRLATREPIADFEGSLVFDRAHRRVLGITDHAVIAYALETGAVAWRADRGPITGPESRVRQGGRLLLGAEGVLAIDLADGSTWNYPMPASRGGVYAIGGNGGFVQVRTLVSMFGGKNVTAMCSTPLVRDGRVYFAAETSVVCLDLETGRCRWRSDLRRGRGFSFRQRALGLPDTPELLGRLIVRDAGSNLLVASLGWAPAKDHAMWADPPTVALVSKEDGHVVRRIGVEGTKILVDVKRAPDGDHLLLAPDRLIVMDDSLNVRRVFRPRADLFELTDFFPCDDPLVLAAVAGITAVAPDSVAVWWERKMGVRATWSDAWDAPIEAGETVDPASGAGPGFRWVVSTTGLTGLDPENGCRPAIFYPLTGAARAEIDRRTALLYSGRTVTLLPLPRPRE